MSSKTPKITGIPFDLMLFVLFLFFSMLALAYLLVAKSKGLI
ncbi:MAG: hypothetical protein V1702_03110 [Candidatus Woesearchaeota archaeon]